MCSPVSLGVHTANIQLTERGVHRMDEVEKGERQNFCVRSYQTLFEMIQWVGNYVFGSPFSHLCLSDNKQTTPKSSLEDSSSGSRALVSRLRPCLWLPAHPSHKSLGEVSFSAEVSSSEQQSNKQWRRSVAKLSGIILQFNNGLGGLQVRRQPDWQRGMEEGVPDVP